MKTERRDTPRISIALETLLQYHDQNYRRSVTRDISLDGAFVETRPNSLAKKDQLDVAIRLPSDGESHYHRFHARVVRVTETGAALAFDKTETEAYEALLDLVFSRQGRGLW
jgi:c-di-GMP-binding flagellar brake protein YcgR